MLIEVRLRRCQGRRLSSRDFNDGKVFVGNLRLVTEGSSDRPSQAHLLNPGGVSNHLIAPLNEPMITLVGVAGFVLRGIERLELPDGVHGVVQEWECTPIR